MRRKGRRAKIRGIPVYPSYHVSRVNRRTEAEKEIG
jgi:uracil-DNA glycosylase